MSVNLPDGPLDSLSLAAAKARNKHVGQLADSLQAFDEAPFAGYLDKDVAHWASHPTPISEGVSFLSLNINVCFHLFPGESQGDR